jgi:hypothetical protein
MRSRAGIAVVGTIAVLVAAPASSPATKPHTLAAPPALPRVTMISDSVPASIAFDVGAKATLAQGIDLFLEPGEGRVLDGVDTPGEFTDTGLRLIQTLGPKLGPTVIMSIGDNDLWSQYAEGISAALDELHAAGVKHVLWATLHVSPDHTSYALFNNALRAAAATHPELTILDWNAYAGAHPEWFQGDGVHLQDDGPRALAQFFHDGLAKLGIPAPQQ